MSYRQVVDLELASTAIELTNQVTNDFAYIVCRSTNEKIST